MIDNPDEIAAFEIVVHRYFSFLEADFGFRSIGIRTENDDPREACVAAKFRNGESTIQIAWGPFIYMLNILIRIDNSGVTRHERYVEFEPFLEFASEGRTVSCVPQIYPRMSAASIVRALKKREQVFADGYEGVAGLLASRLRTFLPMILESSAETIRAFHAWYEFHKGS